MRILLAPYQFYKIRTMFKELNGDRLLTVNGAYPGGETCRLSNIAWYALGLGISIHNIHNFALKPRFIFSWYERYIDKMLIKSCKYFVTVSKSCSESLFDRLQSNNENIITIYNGLDFKPNLSSNHHKVLRELNITHRKDVLIMLGTYEERKGHEFLLRAMQLVFNAKPHLHLLICGTGTHKEKEIIESNIKKYIPGKNIHLLGFVQDAETLISSSYILLIPSQDQESFGLTAVEAMQRGIPVVTTDVGGLSETIGPDGFCGYICNKSNIECFSKKILYLIDNKDIYKNMSNNGIKRSKELFTSKRMVNEYFKLLN